MPGGQGGPRFSGFGVGREFAIWGPFPVQAPDNAPETCRPGHENRRFRRRAWVCHLGPFPVRGTAQRTGNVDLVNKV